jgi:hypothetical protein
MMFSMNHPSLKVSKLEKDRRVPSGWSILILSSTIALLPRTCIAGENPATPIQAELVNRLAAGRVSIGDSVLARVQLGWKSLTCELRPGDILQGRVVARKPYSKINKTSELAFVFDKAPCGSPAMKPLGLTVAAIVAADRSRDPGLGPSEEQQPLSEAVGLTLKGNTRSLSQAADTVYNEPRRSGAQSSAPPKELKAGQVVGISHLTLLVGKGPEGSSLLSSAGREVRLDPGTQFVLIPKVSVAASGVPVTAATGTPAPNQPALPDPMNIADEREVCTPPDCNVALDDSPSLSVSIGETHNADFILPLNGLGYLPPLAERGMSEFDYDAGIAYLGPGQLLFTFDPHILVKRTNLEALSFPQMRIIRAIVLDLATKQILKSVDWRVPDSAQYLWPFGQDSVLVHVGNELRVYGPGLQLRQKIPLGRPLAFVRASPSSEYLAIGIVNERHTPEIHRQLEEAEVGKPEEDIEIIVLDSALQPLAKIIRSSRSVFPVLVDDGEVRVVSIGENRWRIFKYSWAGQRRLLAQAKSSCLPSAQSLPGDLLFTTGCDVKTDDKWYRVLRDGKMVLKGSSSSDEFENSASGDASANIFAIGIAHTKKSLPAVVSVFRPSDLQSEHITIYGAKNGKRIFSLDIPGPVPAAQMFAISPREDQLAVLMSDQIVFYRVPAQLSTH